MMRFSAAILLAVLLVCSEARREKLGKLSNSRFSRQISHREYRQFANQQQQGFQQQQQSAFRQPLSPQQAQPISFPQPISVQQPQVTKFEARPVPVRPATNFQARPVPVRPATNFQARPVAVQQPQATRFQARPQAASFQAQPQATRFQAQPQAHAQAQFQNPNVQSNIVNQVMSHKPAHSQLIAFRETVAGYPSSPLTPFIPETSGDGTSTGTAAASISAAIPYPVGSLISKLPDNSSLIRPNIVEGFSCEGRIYGYYADVLNDCQIFHVCLPLKQIHENDPDVARVPDVTYQFSFICNVYTRFSQDSRTCGWENEVIPCELSPELYDMNREFFKTTTTRSPPVTPFVSAPVRPYVSALIEPSVSAPVRPSVATPVRPSVFAPVIPLPRI